MASSNLNAKINLKDVSDRLEDSEYNPDNFPGVIWRPKNTYAVVIIMDDGRLMCTNVRSLEEVESLFSGNLVLVGSALLVTALLLVSTQLVKSGNKKIPYLDALLIGFAQAIATIPGISRSGATISTALLLKNDRSEAAKFSFLMVLLPIIGAALLDILSLSSDPAGDRIVIGSLIVGFLAAYIAGYLACTWMISLVKKGNLYWFAIYCALVGIISIVFG